MDAQKQCDLCKEWVDGYDVVQMPLGDTKVVCHECLYIARIALQQQETHR